MEQRWTYVFADFLPHDTRDAEVTAMEQKLADADECPSRLLGTLGCKAYSRRQLVLDGGGRRTREVRRCVIGTLGHSVLIDRTRRVPSPTSKAHCTCDCT